MWLIFLGFSIIVALVSLFFGWKKSNLTIWSVLVSLSCGLVSLLMDYNNVSQWVVENDVAYLEDVVPYMPKLLCVYVVVLIFINVLSVGIYNIKKI